MEFNCRVFYYINGRELIRSHRLSNSHLLFILSSLSIDSPSTMFSFYGNEDCARLCTYLLRFTYIDENFVEYFTRQDVTSIDVIQFANLNGCDF